MYKLDAGSTQGLPDTEAFVRLLGGLHESPSDELRDLFDGTRALYVSRAPGRLDLLGGIADYSGALVLELPTACATHVALQLQARRSLQIVSLPASRSDRPRLFEMSLSDFLDRDEPITYATAADYFGRERRWAAYVAGVFLVLMRERGCAFDRGARLLINSDVPEGKGVSSSAALEVATMQAVAAAYGLDVPARELAFLCQKVENLVACAPCGVMDQMTSACGARDELLALLCQPGELQGTIRLPAELAVWGVDSGVRHSVSGADYGTVRTAAFMGYRMIAAAARLPCRAAETAGHVHVEDAKWGGYLANISLEEFESAYAAHLPERMSGAEFLARYEGITDRVTSVSPARLYPVRQATLHPIAEHARVRRFAAGLQGWPGAARAEELGALMYESHASYSACGLGSAGTDELVELVRAAGTAAGLYGAKITGGGSGGTVAVLGRRDARAVVEEITAEYARRSGRTPLVLAGSSPGAARFGHLRLVNDR
ncbi:MAG TPA: hypothetical protein VF546_22335 [Pyrinomonadaceae bacterium]|jgi:L-arabinokinase